MEKDKRKVFAFVGGWPASFTVTEVLGIVIGEGSMGTSIIKDTAAKLADVFGGKARGYSKDLRKAKEEAITDMLDLARDSGADAVGGIEHEVVISASDRGGIFLVSVMGTAVKGTMNNAS